MSVLTVVAAAIGLSSAWATTASAEGPPSAAPAAQSSVAAPAAAAPAAQPAAEPAAEPTAEAPPAAAPTDQRGWAPRSLLAVGVASSGLLVLGAGGFGLAQRRRTQRQQDKWTIVRGPARARQSRSPRLIGAHSSRVHAVQLQLRHRGT